MTSDTQSEPLQDIVIIYHAHCQDGFGAAFAAYKKFGEKASYLACSDRVNPPEELEGKEVYILDFSYPKEVLLALEQKVKRLVILDHHISAKEAVLSVKESVFSDTHSGAYLSWEYFVGTEIPYFVTLLEMIDLAKDSKGEHANLITYILSKPYLFSAYEELLQECSNSESLAKVEIIGKAQHDYLELIIEATISEPDFVIFEGYTVPCVNMSLPINEKSIALRELYTKYPPFAISYRFDNNLLKVSLRGDGEVDLASIASKYGGGGHHNAAGFVIPIEYPLPFVTKQNEVTL